jgi:DNA-binding response OmpR family regulator
MTIDTSPTILVVDDEPGALTLIGIMLERGGYAVLKAASAASAREVIEHHSPNLILLDITLPDRNGIDVCAWIRQQPHTDKTPILMLSGLSDGDTVRRCLDAGANDFLVKPLRYVDLLDKLRSYLQPDVPVKAVS